MPNSQLVRWACSDNHLGIRMSLADIERGTKFSVLVGVSSFHFCSLLQICLIY